MEEVFKPMADAHELFAPGLWEYAVLGSTLEVGDFPGESFLLRLKTTYRVPSTTQSLKSLHYSPRSHFNYFVQ